MKHSTLSMLVFCLYMAGLAVALVAIPGPFLGLFGFSPPDGLWVRMFGLTLGILAFFYARAIRAGDLRFYSWTAQARLILLPAFTLFVVVGLAPPVLLLFGFFDTGCAIWTGLALRSEVRRAPAA
jgi:hypothetical protein